LDLLGAKLMDFSGIPSNGKKSSTLRRMRSDQHLQSFRTSEFFVGFRFLSKRLSRRSGNPLLYPPYSVAD
jgi:hypothetical protein